MKLIKIRNLDFSIVNKVSQAFGDVIEKFLAGSCHDVLRNGVDLAVHQKLLKKSR
jgi:hypothetical protein